MRVCLDDHPCIVRCWWYLWLAEDAINLKWYGLIKMQNKKHLWSELCECLRAWTNHYCMIIMNCPSWLQVCTPLPLSLLFSACSLYFNDNWFKILEFIIIKKLSACLIMKHIRDRHHTWLTVLYAWALWLFHLILGGWEIELSVGVDSGWMGNWIVRGGWF